MPGAAAGPRDGSRSMARKVRVAGVPNFGQVTPALFRGAQPSEVGFESLAKMGVEVIVDLRQGAEAEREQKQVAALGMRFVGIPWRCTEPRDVDFAKFLALLEDNPRKKIFVHCRAGVDRTGMMIASYRMAEQGWTAAEALGEMKAFGFSSFHEQVCYGLASYEQRFPALPSSSPAFSTWRLAEQKSALPAPPKP
jgi:tyrosine-protein phosphatase SIW14